ncbi:MAG: hypothetical protein JW999_04470 [Methanotrichaceae archaeon]|nr:hypothetical protein [Methanotrichaceae archaeon]
MKNEEPARKRLTKIGPLWRGNRVDESAGFRIRKAKKKSKLADQGYLRIPAHLPPEQKKS